ncbi:MAG: hypothetical protein ACOYBP_05905 [Microbacteriaceae bacterium]
MARSHLMGFGSVAALSLTLLLTACVGDASVPGVTDNGQSPATSTGTSSATPTPTATAGGTPLTIGCDQLLSLQNVYDYNPNFGQNPTFQTPDQIAPLSKIGGVACGWVNQTSGSTFAVGVAKPDAPTLASVTAQAAASLTSTTAFGSAPVQGYFGVQNGVGVAEAFSNGYQIVITSSDFGQAEDAAQLMQMVIANLK